MTKSIEMRLLLLLFLVSGINCASILMISTLPSYSHFNVAFRLIKELVGRDHHITFINSYHHNASGAEYENIFVGDLGHYKNQVSSLLDHAKYGEIELATHDFGLGLSLTESTLSSEKVQQLLRSDKTFDVVIIEHFFNEALIGMGHHYNAPVILLSPVGISFRNYFLFAAPIPSSYVPNLYGSFQRNMNFWHRLHNFLINNIIFLLRETFYMEKQRTILKKSFKTNTVADDILYNVSLMLCNTHVSVNDAVPHVPNIINIGAYHVNPPKKLSDDLQSYLDKSEEGVILFSLGSSMKSKDLKPESQRSILKAFSKIKQKVLWKFETDLPNVPDNVNISSWLPQQEILAHPNTVAFITHGGMSSIIETVYFGVPIIGIPAFSDQKTNVATAVSNGYAISVSLADLTESSFHWALQEIVNNPKYKENVQLRSRLMHDQPLKPIDSAVYWIEHVIRHKGAPHLRSAGLDLKWYQREMIDIISFLVIIAGTTLTTIYIVLKFIVTRLFFSKRKTKIFTTKDKKNK